MTQYLFVSESPLVLSAPALPDLTALYAANQAFTVWTDSTGGTDITAGLRTRDGANGISAVTDTGGNLPPFRGPDNVRRVWVDFGGPTRAPIRGAETDDQLDAIIDDTGLMIRASALPDLTDAAAAAVAAAITAGGFAALNADGFVVGADGIPILPAGPPSQPAGVAGYHTFANGSSDLLIDPATGLIDAGAVLVPYPSLTGGTPINDIRTLAGAVLTQITSGSTGADKGRYPFLVPDTFDRVFLDRGYGARFEVLASELFEDLSTAIDNAASAIDQLPSKVDDIDLDGLVADRVAIADSATRVALSAAYALKSAPVAILDVAIADNSNPAANLAAIQAVIDATPGATFVLRRATTDIAGTIAVPAGSVLIGQSPFGSAALHQTLANTSCVTLDADAKISNVRLRGLGTDFVAIPAGGSPPANGVRVLGANAVVEDCTMTNFAGIGVLLETAATGSRVNRVTVVGLGSGIIPSGDAASYGIYMRNAPRVTITDCEISDVSIGIIGSVLQPHLSISNVRVHDIPGQHGIYLQTGDGLHLDGIDVWNTALNGIKVQLYSGNAADSSTTTISNVTATSCGDSGLLVYNVDNTPTWKFRNVTINNIVATNCARGVYLKSFRTAAISNVVITNCTQDGLSFLDAWDVTISGISINGAGQNGIKLGLATGGSNARLKFQGVKVRNPATLNTPSNQYGVLITDALDVTFDGLDVSCDNGLMVYGLYVQAGNQATFTVRNSSFSGDTGVSVRLIAGPAAVKEWSNNALSGSIVAFPTAIPTRIGGRATGSVYAANTVPAVGTFRVGDECVNSTPVVGQPKGWLCTATGTPGTWVSVGNL